ncbi:uncharacterized protein LOC119074301 isoform X2 [Bradysia coprophila]|uniref:uncharacterized protein LOC119074301 isoform X2 n=1 Tax=Bradysia coprophila TaxID=38358 RepID=UPI00187DAA54|nr:uncharacterized protein LOC119074301 isoform X2 [Bradysia coprophila]
MALVMLPCDLPWWTNIHKKLTNLQECTELDGMLDIMQKIHDLCNVSLDPDEDRRDPTLFDGLKSFVTSEMDAFEMEHFLSVTIKNLAKRAQSLKMHRPARGLEFSLQQQADSVEINYDLVAALLANAFFSTFPKRTEKTHPTLQDFNFTHFFKALQTNSQKAKFRSFLNYFDWIENDVNEQDGFIRISRQVMTGKQWLTIEDWLECGLPLCSLEVKHEGKIERSKQEVVQTVFVSPRLGGNVLHSGSSQECIHFSTFPEILATLLYVEALEDNEAILIENARQLTRIMDPKNKSVLETLECPRKVSLVLIDAENYSEYPISQFEEDNVLRELNKCLLAFRQKSKTSILDSRDRRSATKDHSMQRKFGLSPIGESGTNSPKDVSTTIVIRQPSTSTKRSSYDSEKLGNDLASRRSYLSPGSFCGNGGSVVSGPVAASQRRGRFIVLGSSGECLPVSRRLLPNDNSSVYSSCDSESEEYHSAKASFDNDSDDDEVYAKKYSKELNTPEKRNTFAQKLRAALKQSDNYTDSTDSSYAVDISISGSKAGDDGIRIRRGGSRGFMLTEDSMDDDFYINSLIQEKEWLDKFRKKLNASPHKPETNASSKYSFSTSEFSSDLEELYDQFAKWLGEPILKNNVKELDPRDEAVLSFANSLLKRTLSESFVGMSLTDGVINEESHGGDNVVQETKKTRQIMSSRSLSLELAKHKHRLAAQLISQLHGTGKIGCRPVATGNWGCGNSLRGDVQLKLVIQWMAASVSGIPVLIYYTSGDEKLTKLDTVCRVLLDRKWTVGELASATLAYAQDLLDHPNDSLLRNQCFFEKLIGI